MFRVTIDETACEGIFACLVRDDRFVESEAGLAGVDPDAAVDLERGDDRIVATFEEGRERAEQAAAACPPNAISVETVEGSATADGPRGDACR
jgi:ferredoxin